MGVIWASWIEIGGALVAINMPLVSIFGAHTTLSYAMPCLIILDLNLSNYQIKITTFISVKFIAESFNKQNKEHHLKPDLSMHILSISNFSSKHLNLRTVYSKSNQLRILIGNLLIDNIFVKRSGF